MVWFPGSDPRLVPQCWSRFEEQASIARWRRTGIIAFCVGLLALYLGSLVGCQVVISRTPSSRETPATRTPAQHARPASAKFVATPSPSQSKQLAAPTPLPATVTPVPLAAQSPPTRIVAHSIGLDAPVVPIGWHEEERNGQLVSVWDVASQAAGWHINSVYPGQPGNVVLSGHHNIDREVFRYVVDLTPGDQITLYADGSPYIYVVSSRFIFPEKGVPETQRQQNARWIGPTRDSRLTLVTCWPYTNNTHRVIVVAKLLDNALLARNN